MLLRLLLAENAANEAVNEAASASVAAEDARGCSRATNISVVLIRVHVHFESILVYVYLFVVSEYLYEGYPSRFKLWRIKIKYF